jgi:hypothetical protein
MTEIDALPTAPNRSQDPDTYVLNANNMMAALPPMVEQINTVTGEIEAAASAVATAETNAATSADDAEASALTALNAPGTSATSTTSLTIGLGTKTLSIQSGKSIALGATVKIASTLGPTNWMIGDVVSYSGTTLQVDVNNTQGSGSASAWTVSISGVNATRESLGAAASGENSDITKLLGLTTPLSKAQGGSGHATGETSKIQSITAALGSSAMTVSLAATTLDFRSATLTDGATTSIESGAISLVVPSGATLGTTNGVSTDLLVLAIDHSGTTELAIVNVTDGSDYNENGLISTTALSAGSDSANTVYSTTARSNVPYRVVGFIRSAQATAGTWATALTLVQGSGGKSLSGLAAPSAIRKQKFVANGSWVCPQGVTTAYISGIGCGGGGGGSGATPTAGTDASDSTFGALVTLVGGHGGEGGGVSAVAKGGNSGSGRGFMGGDGIGLTMSGSGGGKGGGLGTSTNHGNGGDAASQTGGGGGGGGPALSSYVPSGGGGSGEIADFKSVTVVPGTSYTVTIGNIGTGGAGGDTTGGNGATGYFIVEW